MDAVSGDPEERTLSPGDHCHFYRVLDPFEGDLMPLRQLEVGQIADTTGAGKYLIRLSQGGDSGRDVYPNSVIAVLNLVRRSGVDSDANLGRETMVLAVLRKGALDGDCAIYRRAGPLKDREESVTATLHVTCAMRGEKRAQRAVVPADEFGPRIITDGFNQVCRLDDVREEIGSVTRGARLAFFVEAVEQVAGLQGGCLCS